MSPKKKDKINKQRFCFLKRETGDSSVWSEFHQTIINQAQVASVEGDIMDSDRLFQAMWPAPGSYPSRDKVMKWGDFDRGSVGTSISAVAVGSQHGRLQISGDRSSERQVCHGTVGYTRSPFQRPTRAFTETVFCVLFSA